MKNNASLDKLKLNLKNKNKLSLIDVANLYLLKRVNDCTPYYNVKNWEKDYAKSQYYKKNHCQLPIINFKRYKKPDITNRKNANCKFNYDSNTLTSSLLLSNDNIFMDANTNSDYVSLQFYLNNKSLEEHPYIIITSLNALFSDVIQKLFKTIPFLNKENIIGYISHDNDKDKTSLLELNKSVEENGLNDGSKIIIQFK